MGGRLSNAALSQSQKHPVILHGKDILTALFAQYKHVFLLHAGPTLLLSSIGSSLHVLGARRLIRNICRSCVVCRRASAMAERQQMGQLPTPRVTANPPFSRTGLDFAGPFIMKRGHTRRPSWSKHIYACSYVLQQKLHILSLSPISLLRHFSQL